VETLCENRVLGIIVGKRVGFSADVAGIAQKIGHGVVAAFDMLAGEAVGAGKDESS
jgi:hypothetical protein